MRRLLTVLLTRLVGWLLCRLATFCID
jgi:hypothetical protein